MDSSKVNSASAESMDCHAANAARNDKVGGVDCRAAAATAAAARNDSKQLTQTLLAMTIKRR